MSNETTLPAPTEAQKAMTLGDQLGSGNFSADDLVIPKLLLMQNTSEYVGDGKATMGDIVNSQTLEVVGKVGQPLEVVLLGGYKDWRVYDLSGSQPKLKRIDRFTPENARQEWEGNEDGQPIRRDLCLNFYALLKKDIEAGEAFPTVITFKRTSSQAGKQMATEMFKAESMGRPVFAKTAFLGVTKQKKETNTYAVFQVTQGRATSVEEQAAAANWLKRINSMKVDEREADEPVTAKGAVHVAAPTVVTGSQDSI